jgi:hypothetical protein
MIRLWSHVFDPAWSMPDAVMLMFGIAVTVWMMYAVIDLRPRVAKRRSGAGRRPGHPVGGSQ